jgi:Tol biopolymer transport system component
MSLAPGTRVGVYQVAGPLGKGGMGEVYRARDTRLNRDVALKVLPELLASDPDRLARFRNEAQLLASLNHPNIAAVYGFEESPSRHALVLELVDGPTLADRIAHGPIPVSEALTIAKQMTDALESAHAHGIVHRDLKPANIKVRSDGTVKVLDFGLAKALSRESGPLDVSLSPTFTSPAMTAAGMILGTAAYMSPEQATGRAVDVRTDIWAFGVVLYEMLTGVSPFAGATTLEVLSKVLRDEPDWAALPAQTPAAMRSLLRRCLQRDPARRLRDISDARFQIEDSLSEPAVVVALARRSARGVERWLWAAALVVVAVTAAAAMRYYGRSQVEPGEIHLEITTPATTAPTSIAISPDGRTVVYAALAGGKEELWVRSLNNATATALAGTDGARYPFWSPDSRSIGFFVAAQLKRIDVATGAVQTLASAGNPFGGTWNFDDTILFTPGPSHPVMRVSATGGTAVAVTRVSAQAQNHRFPQILPGGRHFLYYATGSASGIYVGEVAGADSRKLLDAEAATFAAPGHLLFVKQGALYAQAFDPGRAELSGRPTTLEQQIVSRSGVGTAALSASLAGPVVYRPGTLESDRQLIWVDRTGKELQRVSGSRLASGITIALSPDGRTVASEQLVDGSTDIWFVDLARGVSTRATSNPEFELYAVWSPDGRRIAFTSNRTSVLGSMFDLYVKTIGDERNELLVGSEGGQLPTDWSRDGRFILYTDSLLQDDLARNIMAVAVNGDRKPFPVVQSNHGANNGQFSPDGKWIAYQSMESGAQQEIFIQRFPGPGGKLQISTAGGVQPRWRQDGRELFYLAPDNRLIAVSIALDSVRDIAQVGAPVPLLMARLSGTPQGPTNRQYSVSSDGQRFLLDTPAESAQPISVVLNWKPMP